MPPEHWWVYLVGAAVIGVPVVLFIILAVLAVKPARPPRLRPVICPNPNCGYRGIPRVVKRNDWRTGCFLFWLSAPAGWAYQAFTRGYRKFCPQCGMELGARFSNPKF